MKLFGNITELVKVVLRKSGFAVTVEPSTASADTTFQLPAAGGGTKTLVTTDAPGQVLTGKTIDGDDNTITDISISSLKTTGATDANKVIVRDGAGAVTSAKIVNNNVDSAAAIAYSKLNIADGDLTIAKTSGLQTALNGKAANGANSDITSLTGLTTPLSTGQGGTGVNSTATFPSSGTVVTRDAAETLLNKDVSSTAALTGALRLPVGNATTERPSGTAAQLKGMVRYNDTDDVFEGYNELSGWSSIGGGGTTDRVTQASHGFVVGDILYLNGSTYAKAKADAANTAEVVGMVSRVIDSSTFELTLSGEVSGLSSLTVGEVYFLSASTAGATTITEPSVVGQVSLPVGIASSATTMYVAPKRGILIGATNVRTQISLANNATTTVQSVSAYEAGELSGWVAIAATTSLKFFVAAKFAKNGAGTDYNISYQTTGDVPPVGFQITVTSAGLIQCVMPNVTGFASASINYGLNVAAVGATLPLSISARNVIGDTTGTAVPAGYIGETISAISYNANDTGLAAGTWVHAGSDTITLTTGTWLLYGTVRFYPNGTTNTIRYIRVGFSTASGNNATGMVDAYTGESGPFTITSAAAYERIDVKTVPQVITLAASQQYWLKSWCAALSGGWFRNGATLVAVRIA